MFFWFNECTILIFDKPSLQHVRHHVGGSSNAVKKIFISKVWLQRMKEPTSIKHGGRLS